MRYVHGFFMSFGMFCAIPCLYRPWNEKARDLMIVFLPIVGIVIGMIWYLFYRIMDAFALPMQLQAALLMIYPYIVTGFIHLDGFMDTNDATLSRRPLEDKLRILKDPHTGAFAVISVVILFFISYASMSAVIEALNAGKTFHADAGIMISLIFIPAITRVCSAVAVLNLKPLGHSQYSGEFRDKSKNRHTAVVLIFGIIALSAAHFLYNKGGNSDFNVLIVLFSAALAYAAALANAIRQLGGISGDLSGYALTIGECAAVAALAIII